LFDAHTYVDKSLVEQGDSINFNAGLRTKSCQISTADYLEVEKPKLVRFAESAEAAEVKSDSSDSL